MLAKRSYWLVLLMLLLGMALVACGGGEAEPAAEESGAEEPAAEAPAAEEEADCSSEELLCVGLVTDVGEVDDKSFNQSAWEGVKLAESELGAQVDFIETKDAKDYGANIALFAENGYDIIVTVGFAMGEATGIAATEYPDIDFIGVDQFQGWPYDDDASNDFANEDFI